MGSMKDALLKVGIQTTKTKNERKFKATKDQVQSEKHQQHRNHCEVCDFIQPDVERFKHNNPLVDAEWICSNCADKSEILDSFRITNQSDHALKGSYRRQYGHTKDFTGKGDINKVKKPARQTEKKKEASKFKVDDDGEKNFNC